MHECAKGISAKLPSQVLNPNPGADVPDVSWIRESEATSRASRRFIEEPLVFWITTDDSIQRDDIGGKKLIGNADKIAVDESHRVGSAPTRRLLGRRRDIGR
jgi:hypothetical protein